MPTPVRPRIGFEQDAQRAVVRGDDGRGGVATDGNGLAGMRDRVRALGGTLSIDSPRGGGTRLLVARGARMIRILLAEDQALVRGALSRAARLESDIEVLGAAADGEAAWRDVQRLKHDVLVTDIEMPGLSGLELAQRIQRQGLPIKVVIVTTSGAQASCDARSMPR